MTTLATMMTWYGPDPDVVEKECQDCGQPIAVPVKNAWRRTRCDRCAAIHDHERNRSFEVKESFCSGDPAIDLVAAIIEHAVEDAKHGDSEARQFLRASDGAELYLRAAGVEVTPFVKRRLYWDGRKERKG